MNNLVNILIAIANGVVGLISVYIVVIYGNLHWWYRAARRTGLESQSLRDAFLTQADRLPIIALVLASSALLGNAILLRSSLIPRRWGIAFMLLSLFCLVACVVVKF